jgi:glucosylceramidase
MQSGPWSTEEPQGPGMWFQLELPAAATLVELQMDASTIGGGRGGRGGSGGRGRGGGPAPLPDAGFPRSYRVEVSEDGEAWRAVAGGAGQALTTTATFAPVRARFVRVTQTSAAENLPVWTIQRLRLYEAP